MRRMCTASLRGILLLAFCSSALATAYAGTIITYTDSLTCIEVSCSMGFDFYPPPQPLTTYGATASGYFTFLFVTFPPNSVYVSISSSFCAPLSDFEEEIGCGESGCSYFWGGDFNSGTIGMTAEIDPIPYGPPQFITLTGVISAGSFSASYFDPSLCYPFNDCAFQSFDLDFSGHWSNGWQSTGTMSGTEQIADFGYGSLLLNIQTPEPASLCLFGTGVIGLAGTLQRKRASRKGLRL